MAESDLHNEKSIHQPPSWTHGYLKTNGVRLHYVTQGEGPLMLMLHGFPDFWYVWRQQIPAFASEYKVVAADLRGYNESEKPAAREDYQISTLVEDIKGIIQGLGYERCILVGHDWGGAIAWRLADRYPELLEGLIILNMPHPARFLEGLKTLPQLLKSWYIFLFQLPLVPEWLLSRRNFKPLVQLLEQTSVSSTASSPEDREAYRLAVAQPGALTAMLNYYRNLFQRSDENYDWQTIQTPTLLIWGENDVALGKELTFWMEPYVKNLTLRYIPSCGHWVQREQPQLVNQYIRQWLTRAL
jgi:epoxide hydrolase 4